MLFIGYRIEETASVANSPYLQICNLIVLCFIRNRSAIQINVPLIWSNVDTIPGKVTAQLDVKPHDHTVREETREGTVL